MPDTPSQFHKRHNPLLGTDVLERVDKAQAKHANRAKGMDRCLDIVWQCFFWAIILAAIGLTGFTLLMWKR